MATPGVFPSDPPRRGRPRGSHSPIGPKVPGTPADEPEGEAELEPYHLARPIRAWRPGIRRSDSDDLAKAAYIDRWLRRQAGRLGGMLGYLPTRGDAL